MSGGAFIVLRAFQQFRGRGGPGNPEPRSERGVGTTPISQLPLAEEDLRRAILCNGGSDEHGLPRCTQRCLAHFLGWRGMYVKPLMDRHFRWRTPTRGDLGEGWPDLFLFHPRRGRILAAELKAEGKYPTPEQAAVLEVMEASGMETHVWHPADLDSGEIMRTLR